MVTKLKLSSVNVSEETATKLASLFRLSSGRGGARKKRGGGWSRIQTWENKIAVHSSLTEDEFKNSILTGKPIAVSFLRLETDIVELKYTYHPEVEFLCVDVDLKINDVPLEEILSVKEKIHDAIEYISEKMVTWGLSPGLTHSGSKGYHIFNFLDEPIDSSYMIAFFNELMQGCPHFEESATGSKWNLYGKNGMVYSEIDSLFKTGDGGVIKVPFSQHQNKTGYYELPIAFDDLRFYEPEENPSKEVFKKAEAVLSKWTVVPSTVITDAFSSDDVFSSKPATMKRKIWAKKGDLKLPEVSDVSDILETILSFFDPKSKYYTPCMAKTYEWSLPPKRSRYNMRTVLVRQICARVKAWFNINHEAAKGIAALFIREYINDEEDNLHPEENAYHTNYWCDNHMGVVTNCHEMQKDGTPYKCCDTPCGREELTDKFVADETYLLNLPTLSEDSLEEILNKARVRGGHTQIFKTTRAGGTTTIIANALEHNEKIAVIVPTTRIAETIQEAMRLAKNGNVKIGILMPRNTEACLKVKMKVEDAEDEFDEVSALEQLPFVFRYNCAQCPYVGNTFDIEPGEVLTSSSIPTVQCLYTTNIQAIRDADVDVLVLTNKKLYNLVLADRAATENEHIPGMVDATFILGWISNVANVALLDEISMMIDQPDLELPLYCTPADDPHQEVDTFDLIAKVEDELFLLEQFRNDELVQEIQHLMGTLVGEYFRYRDETGITLYERDITQEENDTLSKYLKRIQAVASRTNIALTWLFKSILASKEAKWVVLQEPDLNRQQNVKIYTLPKFSEGVSEFLLGSKVRLIAMDATHPLSAARHLDKIIGAHFNRVNIGDPHDSADLQRIIPWPTAIKAPQLVSKDKHIQRWVSKEIKDALTEMNNLFGFENIIIAVPNKLTAVKVRNMFKGHRLDIMWHRGSESIGVKNEKRIMIGLCAPYAPRESHNWLKDVIHPEILSDVSYETLWRYDRNKTEFQTLSRVKDPNFAGDGRRSVYIAFGQPINDVEQMRSTNVVPPGVIPVANAKIMTSHSMPPLLAAYVWIQHGETLTPPEQMAARLIYRGEDNVRKIKNHLHPTHISGPRVEEIKKMLKECIKP